MTLVKEHQAAPKAERSSFWSYIPGLLVFGFIAFKLLEAYQPEWYANGTLSGQVFLVSGGTEVQRIPLAEIKVIRDRDINGWIEECAARRDKYRTQAQQVAGRITPLLAEKNAMLEQQKVQIQERDAALKALDEWKARNAGSRDAVKVHLDTQNRIFKKWSPRIDEVGEKIRACEKGIETLIQESSHLRSLANEQRVWVALGPIQTVAKTSTDTDGKFNARIPRHGKFAVSAIARRQTNAGVEHLRWLVWVDMEGKRTLSIDLHNQNIDGAGSSKSPLPSADEW